MDFVNKMVGWKNNAGCTSNQISNGFLLKNVRIAKFKSFTAIGKMSHPQAIGEPHFMY